MKEKIKNQKQFINLIDLKKQKNIIKFATSFDLKIPLETYSKKMKIAH